MRIFGFIAAKKAEHSISIMCRVLGVSRSGFHAWQARKPSKRALEDRRSSVRIAELHERCGGSPDALQGSVAGGMSRGLLNPERVS